jgi:hypothetical protein
MFKFGNHTIHEHKQATINSTISTLNNKKMVQVTQTLYCALEFVVHPIHLD